MEKNINEKKKKIWEEVTAAAGLDYSFFFCFFSRLERR